MRIARFALAALLLLSVAALPALAAPEPAPSPGPAPLSDAALAAILGTSSEGGSCATGQPMAKGPGGLNLKAVCTVQCDSGSVSCTGTPNCTAVNRDCSILEPGHVTCNGVTTSCTPACCSTGTMREKACCRCEATANCQDCCRCDGGTIVQCALACG